MVGFTEQGSDGRLYNASAVFSRGDVLGIYRKMHPAINRSVYHAGTEAPVFTVGNVTFGILICRDSLFHEPARLMVSRGAQILLVPTNNGMPLTKGGEKIVTQARACDIARALESSVPVVRADVAGNHDDLVSCGSSCILDRNGRLVGAARARVADLIVADIDVGRFCPANSLEDFASEHPQHVRATKKMPNPQTLKIGDRVRFISLPEEWKQPGYGIHRDSSSFMKRMIKRTSPLRVTIIDEFGTPWVSAITIERGKRNYHGWAITEETGWRMVVPQKKRNAQPS